MSKNDKANANVNGDAAIAAADPDVKAEWELVKLGAVQFDISALGMGRLSERVALLGEELASALAAIDERYDAAISALTQQADVHKAAATTYAKACGATVTGPDYMAVYTPGGYTYDTDWLNGYAAAHAEILEARRPVAPKVSIRRVVKREGVPVPVEPKYAPGAPAAAAPVTNGKGHGKGNGNGNGKGSK